MDVPVLDGVHIPEGEWEVLVFFSIGLNGILECILSQKCI